LVLVLHSLFLVDNVEELDLSELSGNCNDAFVVRDVLHVDVEDVLVEIVLAGL